MPSEDLKWHLVLLAQFYMKNQKKMIAEGLLREVIEGLEQKERSLKE